MRRNHYDYHVCKGCYTVIRDMQIITFITNLYRNPDQPINVTETVFCTSHSSFHREIQGALEKVPLGKVLCMLGNGVPSQPGRRPKRNGSSVGRKPFLCSAESIAKGIWTDKRWEGTRR